MAALASVDDYKARYGEPADEAAPGCAQDAPT